MSRNRITNNKILKGAKTLSACKKRGAPPKAYRTKVFGIRHKAEIIDKVRNKFNKELLISLGKAWLDQLAQQETD